LFTPPLGRRSSAASRANGIITPPEAGYTVTEAILPRELPYIADEVFSSGHRLRGDACRSVDRDQSW
jgi:hypothetical protein